MVVSQDINEVIGFSGKGSNLLYKHQESTARWLQNRKSGAVLSEQGTGKTYSVIEYLNRRSGAPEKILVVCPATIVGVWAEEIKKFSGVYADRAYILNGTRKKRLKILSSGLPGIYIINYEGLRALRENHNLAKLKWSVVIADEMTRVKNHRAKQSKALHDFVKFCPLAIRIGLTGTPITQSPLDAFSQFYFIDPSIFGKSWWDFRHRHAIIKQRVMGGRSFQEISGYKNLPELSKKISNNSIRFTKSECLDLPPKIYQKMTLEWPKKNRAVYDQMAKELITEIGEDVVAVPNALAKMIKLRQICGGWLYNEDKKGIHLESKNPKLEALRGILEGSEKPVIIWCCFREDVRLLEKEFEDYTSISLSGAVEKEERQKMVNRFQKGGIKLAICQINTAQYGITLTQAPTAVFFSQSWSVESRLQAEDRCHRIGQENKCLYIDLLMKDSIDESISQILFNRKKLASSITNNSLQNLLKGKLDGQQIS